MTEPTLDEKLPQEEEQMDVTEEVTIEVPEDLTLETCYVELTKQIRSLAMAINDVNRKMYADFNDVLAVRDQKLSITEQETVKGVMALSNGIVALGAGFKVIEEELVKLGVNKDDFQARIAEEARKADEAQRELATQMVEQQKKAMEEAAVKEA